MYVEIKENKLLSWCGNHYADYEFVDIDYSTFDEFKYEVQDGQLVNISQTQEYQDRISQEQNEILKLDLLKQIDELDKKRIRAIAEPQLKDEENGQTWLEHYTQQIIELRTEIINL